MEGLTKARIGESGYPILWPLVNPETLE